MVHGEKSKKFNGLNFKRWQQKILFYLTTLNLVEFWTKKTLKSSKNEYDPTIMVDVDAWNHNDLICKNYILNGLKNALYNMYSSIMNANKKYKTEDARFQDNWFKDRNEKSSRVSTHFIWYTCWMYFSMLILSSGWNHWENVIILKRLWTILNISIRRWELMISFWG